MNSKVLFVLATIVFFCFPVACGPVQTENDNGNAKDEEIKERALTPVESQRPIPRVTDNMPTFISGYKLKDFKTLAKAQDMLLFDSSLTGEYFPLIKYSGNYFSLPSYVGDKLAWGEALASIGSVVGASLVGIDKSNQGGYDYVRLLKPYFNQTEKLVLNNVGAGSGSTFWYEIFPSVAFFKLVDLYPKFSDIEEIMKKVADRWVEGIAMLSRGMAYPNFDHTALNFSTSTAYDNGIWKEPDAAAGVAWMEYMAYRRFGDKRYLSAAKLCMDFLSSLSVNKGPYYEILMPYGSLLAARMNAESGTRYDIDKFISFSMDGNNSYRHGWGVIIQEVGGISMSGLVGQQHEQYAFAMNTFDQMSTMLPIARYAPEYGTALGLWALNCISASRLFYEDEHPADRQTAYGRFIASETNPICYEGVRGTLEGGNFEQYKATLASVGPYGVGDRQKCNDTRAGLDFCPYGSAWVGELAAIYNPTDVEQILQLDCRATDFFGDDTYPTFLYYNPYNTDKEVSVTFSDEMQKADIYDMYKKKIILVDCFNGTKITIPSKSSCLIVTVPPNSKTEFVDSKVLVNGKIIDHNYIYNEN